MLILAGFAKLGLCITSYAIYRPVFTRLEWNFGSLSALCADCCYHLAGTLPVTTTINLSGLAACWTAFGLIGISLGSKKFLLFFSERETSLAFRALDTFVLKTHWMPSL
jgi:hypothetical protein